ncbi:5-(carboxyamino)imidazole ribonucleotide synthase [Sphingomonas sp.]|uniref:5-(carboxyamino)imidazole ribonucleotide synthase n=1 Tax=Sphingomonas sp. TaxID=28214 RepID=UPI003AFFB679
MIVPPGGTIGILGGGQLGRMLAMAAARLGYRAHIYAPGASGPASEVAAHWTQGAYDDEALLARFADAVDVVTYEFENVDPRAVARVGERVAVHPSPRSLEVSRYRPAEKTLVAELGGRTAPWAPVPDGRALAAALATVGTPAILKTTLFGYDGKGQARIDDDDAGASAWAAIGAPATAGDQVPAILEGRVAFAAEFSVILCRATDGRSVVWDVPENVHRDGILATSTVPSGEAVQRLIPDAVAMTRAIADRLDHVGVLTAEYFATDDGPVFNEMAPRVHNSGHWTIEGAVTSQFENHVRAICGLPLGATSLAGRAATMENLIGDEAGRWPALLAEPDAKLHLYGKTVRPGRKMGHVTRVGR